MRMTRRDGIGGMLAAFLLPARRRTGSAAEAKRALEALFSDMSAARAIGAAYLRSHGTDGIDLAIVENLKSAIAARVRDDFANARVVSVDGWLLAETEVRLCAVACLAA